MKLNAVARTVSQLQVEALPEGHPLIAQLNQMYGDHIYFLDTNGLNIVEPAVDLLEVPASSMGGWGGRKSRKLDGLQSAQARSTRARID
jgi:hypothetical protein